MTGGSDASGSLLGPAEEPPSDDAPGLVAADAPVGGAPVAVRRWFDILAVAEKPENDGSLAAAHESARAYRSRAKADNTRAAYRSAVRAWCTWCVQHGVPPLPAASRDVAAFLAAGRDRGQGDIRRPSVTRRARVAGGACGGRGRPGIVVLR